MMNTSIIFPSTSETKLNSVSATSKTLTWKERNPQMQADSNISLIKKRWSIWTRYLARTLCSNSGFNFSEYAKVLHLWPLKRALQSLDQDGLKYLDDSLILSGFEGINSGSVSLAMKLKDSFVLICIRLNEAPSTSSLKTNIGPLVFHYNWTSNGLCELYDLKTGESQFRDCQELFSNDFTVELEVDKWTYLDWLPQSNRDQVCKRYRKSEDWSTFQIIWVSYIEHKIWTAC